ncbi:hypothetical protein LTR37_003572 [Vermiconidia calcicola]|uniref:Uncharacterized protein n=1 Tax=Vermiconidia calcicola TaxID=1690605 RepID=A0ACC3NPS5_9PEZI|nr:hypothetical protein LTR37_003572 [Vermiconidia calcicola]
MATPSTQVEDENEAVIESIRELYRDRFMDPCYLLRLPGELRNEIFELTLCYPKGFAIYMTNQYMDEEHPLGLTETCKWIRRECGNMFFEENEITYELPVLQCASQPEAVQQDVTSEFARGFKRSILQKELAPKLQRFHLSAGILESSAFQGETALRGFHRAWSVIEEAIVALHRNDLKLRLSFGLKFKDEYKIPVDVFITAEQETLEAFKRCFKPFEPLFAGNDASELRLIKNELSRAITRIFRRDQEVER